MITSKNLIYILAGVAVLVADFSAWKTSALNNYLPFFMTTDGWNRTEQELNNGSASGKKSALTEAEARVIAEKSCIKGGEALSTGFYNEITKTWWFDANLNATREGCNPACVVSEKTKSAAINWRCTGLKTPDNKSCGIENCHGLDIVCGPNPARMCTEMYQLGDRCRQFVECRVVDGKCQQIDNPQFTACKACAQKCESDFPSDPDKMFTCENKCGE
jgi:hypothetical protein